MRSLTSVLARFAIPVALAATTTVAPPASAEPILHVGIFPTSCYSATGHVHFGVHLDIIVVPTFVASLTGVGEQAYLIGQNPYADTGLDTGNPAEPTVQCGALSPQFGSVVYTLGYVGIGAPSGTFHVACVTALSTMRCTPKETNTTKKTEQTRASLSAELYDALVRDGVSAADAAAAVERAQSSLVKAGVPA